jgi:hypothetical protein
MFLLFANNVISLKIIVMKSTSEKLKQYRTRWLDKPLDMKVQT